ncbi:MAG: SH3 domain-containing protein [Anaerolineae bacterium]|nr:SH3 domain-containing protein [Anaerolineae bacterium]
MRRNSGMMLLVLITALLAGCNIPRGPSPEQQQTLQAATSEALTQIALTSAASPGGGPPAIITSTPFPLSPTPTQFAAATTAPLSDAVVATDNLRLRQGPSTAFPVILSMPNGTPLTVTGKNGNYPQDSQQLWLRVTTGGGGQGWTAGWLLTISVNLANVPVVATPVPPTPRPTSTFTPAPSTEPFIQFWADSVQILPGQCTTLHWNVENIQAVFLDGQPTVGQGEMEVCPAQTFTSILTVQLRDGSTTYASVTVYVLTEPQVSFRADRYQIAPGQCTYVRWDVEGAQAVFFQGQGVVGHSNALVCPGVDTTYHLQVTHFDGSRTYDYYQTIYVNTGYYGQP